MDDAESLLVIKACRVCQSDALASILTFGDMPLANRYPIYTNDAPEPRYPLEVVLCNNCGCVQLAHTVNPQILFSDYLYTSSTSGSLAEHFLEYAKSTVNKFGWEPGRKRFIVGIGGNDGPLEKAYQNLGFQVLNVEAAENIAKLSVVNGVPTYNRWFTVDAAQAIVTWHGQADLITCNNCFAHMPDIHGVLNAIKILLKPGGWFVCEEGYWLDAVKGNHFDRIYHEHVFYWTVRALNLLFHQHGLAIVDVEHNNSQGGSIRVFVREDNGMFHPKVHDDVEREIAGGLFNPYTYSEWSKRIDVWRTKCNDFLYPLESLSCYGVPAKFAMISEKLGFRPKRIAYAVEDSPIKVGRFTPGAHIPIVSRQHFAEHPTEHCIITAANYADLIIKNNPQFKGQWIVLTPEPRFL